LVEYLGADGLAMTVAYTGRRVCRIPQQQLRPAHLDIMLPDISGPGPAPDPA
jgi:hypothetical protein